MRYIYIALVCIVMLITIGVASAESIETNGSTFDDIQTTIDVANPGDTIELDGEYSSNSAQINLTKTMTLQGKNNAVLDGAKKSSILCIEADNVTIRDITFKNAKGDLQGGAITLKGNNITMVNCRFISNDAYNGAGIYWLGRDGFISNCTFEKNTAEGYGGAFMWAGPAEFSDLYNPFNLTGNERFTMENCRFVKNTAEEGGAVYAASGYFLSDDYRDGEIIRCLPTEMIGCEFESNRANRAGALYWGEACQASGSIIHVNNITVKKSKFSKNKADWGSAIYLDGDNNRIEGCSFASNTGKSGIVDITGENISVSGSDFKSNNLTEFGSLCFDGQNITVSGCVFASNRARSAPAMNGGGNDILVSDCRFTSNTAEEYGCAGFNALNLTVDGCKFSKNTCEYGGGLYLRGYNQIVKNSVFDSNRARMTGGAIYWTSESTSYKISEIENTRFEFENNSFTSNTAGYSEGAVYFYTQSLDETPKIKSGAKLNIRASLKNCSFSKNSAKFTGALSWQGKVDEKVKIDVGRIELDSCSFTENKATKGGSGAAYIGGANNKISNSVFSENSAFDFGGGALQAEGSNLQITSSSFVKNTVNANGGAISFTGSGLKVNGCTFIKNKAKKGHVVEGGGAICINGKNSVIENSSFTQNYAASGGGAIEALGDGNVIRTSVFRKNTAEAGGAIYCSGKTGSINYCIFDDNTEFDSKDPDYVRYCGGNAVYAKVSIDNNFWGYNTKKADFENRNLAVGNKPGKWINLKITKSALEFTDNSGKACVNMPSFTFRLVDANGNLIKRVGVERGVGKTNLTKSFTVLTPSGIHVSKISGKLKVSKSLSAVHATGKILKITTVKNVGITVLVKNGKKLMPYYLTSNSKGIVSFDASALDNGKNQLEIFIRDGKYNSKTVKSTVTIKKAKATVKAPKVTNKHGKKAYFKLTVKHKTTGKPVKNTDIAIIVKETIPVEYIIKTDSKGVAKFNTQYMKKGTHSVKITSYKNYIMSGSSSIKIV